MESKRDKYFNIRVDDNISSFSRCANKLNPPPLNVAIINLDANSDKSKINDIYLSVFT
jgi:hypothetical protein